MANISWPDFSAVERASIGLDFPGQIRHVSPYTGAMTVLNRSQGLWKGSMTVRPYKDAEDVQRFIDAVIGSTHTFDVPIYGHTYPPIFEAFSAENIGRLETNDFEIETKEKFPYTERTNVDTDVHLRRGASGHQNSVLMTPIVRFAPVFNGVNLGGPANTMAYHLSVWVHSGYADPRGQLFMGLMAVDGDGNPVSSAFNSNWNFEDESTAFEQFTLERGWNQLTIDFSRDWRSSITRKFYSDQCRIFIASSNQFGAQDRPIEYTLRVANLALYMVPVVQSYGDSNNLYQIGRDTPDVSNIFVNVAGRLVRLEKVGKRAFEPTPFVRFPTELSGGRRGSTIIRPTWSVRARLQSLVQPQMRTPDWGDRISFDWVQALEPILQTREIVVGVPPGGGTTGVIN